MIIKRNSWHYRLMDFMVLEPQHRTNICSYWGGFVLAVITAVLLSMLLTTFIIVFPFMAGSDILFRGLSFSDLTWLQVLASCGVGMLLMLSVLGAIIGLAFVSSDIERKTKTKEPGLLAMKLRSVKEKTCYKVDFE